MSPSTTRDTAVKWTAYALACLLLLFGHELTLAHLRVWGIAPFLPPLLPAVLASMEDRLEGDTNNLLTLSTRDPHARRLAARLNAQLRLLRQQPEYNKGGITE